LPVSGVGPEVYGVRESRKIPWSIINYRFNIKDFTIPVMELINCYRILIIWEIKNAYL
jgi:hypothetical protein